MPVFVNDTEIDDNTVFSEMQYHSAPSMEEARDAAAQALVVKELLRQLRAEPRAVPRLRRQQRHPAL